MHLEGYRVLRSLGAGATSEVFAAIKNDSGRSVALKRFSPLVSHDMETRRRLQSEVEALGQLKHPNIVGLGGVFDLPNAWGIELELVDGGHLSEWSKDYELSLLEPKIWILVQIARGLGAAHEQDIIHRDLKPENILVSYDGDVKITDFGLARSLSRVTITKSGLLIGSLAYMAPEVINLSDASARSDIFSFGVIAYELLTGKPPFQSETPQGLIRKITEGRFVSPQIINPAVPKRVSDIVSLCLSSVPQSRPSTIWHVEAELMLALAQSGVMTLAKKLVSVKSRQESIAQAFQAKHSALLTNIENTNGAEKIDFIRELLTLFPNDPKSNEYLLDIQRSQKSGLSKRYTMLVAAVLVSVGVAIAAYRKSASKTVKVEHQVQPQAVVAQGLQAPPSLSSSSSEPVVVKPEQKNGALAFYVPEDVDVFVGGQYISPLKRKKLSVAAGKHLVKMVKDGFMPIENTVLVREGRTAVVRVGGQQ